MSQSLADALNGLVAEAITADLSEASQREALTSALRARTPEIAHRHALRAWLALLARWIDAAASEVPTDLLSEALLAAATWAGGDDPMSLGLEVAIDHVLDVNGIGGERRQAWLIRLREESDAARADLSPTESATASQGATTTDAAPPVVTELEARAAMASPMDEIASSSSAHTAPLVSELPSLIGKHSLPEVSSLIDEPSLAELPSPIDEPSLAELPWLIDEASLTEEISLADEASPMVEYSPTEQTSLGEAETLEAFAPAAPQSSIGNQQTTSVIYIAPEEAQMLLESLHGELLPALVELSMQPAPREPDAGTMFLLQAQGNAFEVLGLTQNSALLKEATEQLEHDNLSDDALALLADWLVQMGELLVASDGAAERAAESGQALAAALAIDAALDECARVRIAIDPSYAERPRRAIGDGDLDLSPADDVIPSVLRGMLQELPHNAESLAGTVERLRAGERGQVLIDARRFAHTLKGDANTVGIRGLANLTHALEDILVALAQQDEVPHRVLEVMSEAADTVAAMADAVLGRAGPPEAHDVLTRVYAIADALERDEPIDLPMADSELLSDQPLTPAGELPVVQQPVADAISYVQPTAKSSQQAAQPEDDEQVSIGRGLLDRLLEQSAESVALSNQLNDALKRMERAEGDLKIELIALRAVAQALDEQITLRAGAIDAQRRRNEEIDALELDQYNELDMLNRRVTEVQSDLFARSLDIGTARAQVEVIARRKQLSDDEIQSIVRRARLVPLSELSPRFQRAARQAARQLGKNIEFEVSGDQIAIDKTVLEGMIEPLMHLIRNAIDHGIETNDERAASGKGVGRVRLGYATQGQTLTVTLSDDGAGIAHERVRQRALELGIAGAADADAATLRRYLLMPGFSTRTEVTQMSGRGVGLDIVAARVQRLGGSLSIDSTTGSGTRFTLALPLSLGNLQVAIIRLGNQRYGLAADSIERLVALMPNDQSTEGECQVRVGGDWYPATDISAVLGGTTATQRPVAAMLSNIDGEQAIVLLPEIETLATVVLKPLGDYLPPIRGIRGATLLGDGSVAPVVDLRELIGADALTVEDAAHHGEVAPLIVVADDSLTIRRSLGELLSDTGYRVELARDGLEALIAVTDKRPAALLVDLEMPRMNGLELTQHLRQSVEFADLPIIMITSRSSEKHRDMAVTAGVSAILGKPYSDEDVLGLLAKATGNT